jgi:hypothetical protein
VPSLHRGPWLMADGRGDSNVSVTWVSQIA